MMQISYEDIVKKIVDEKGLSEEEITEKVKGKLNQLSDLVSKEGAAHIVANELGVKIFEKVGQRNFKIGEIKGYMRSVDVVGKTVRVYEVRTFNKNNREGKVANFMIGDETGVVRVVLWDTNHIQEIEKGNIKEGVIIKLKNAYVRENNGYLEVHLGGQGKLMINPEGEEVGDVNFQTQQKNYIKKQIKDLKENDFNVGILGTVVQLFEPRFYEVCSNCGKRARLEGDRFVCPEHGAVKEKLVPIVNIFFDDGTENIRVVCFREQASALVGMSSDELLSLKDNPEKIDELKNNILGKQIIIVGRVTKNEMFNRLELIARQIVEVNPKEIAEELVKEVS